jgi:transcriptional regulator with XRE-family HTH domain
MIYNANMIEPAQCRARALLDWRQHQLAKAAGLGSATLKRFERGIHMLIKNNMAALRRTLEDAGVEFIARTKTKGPGVRLKE